MPRLSPQQQAALDTVGHTTTVSAGAGAGKTSTMVERYLHIVRQSASGVLPVHLQTDVGGVLTITFTDDAASELKHRLTSRLVELGMVEERRQVETAYISTIHAFCMRLLKENPFEAGLDPEFTLLTTGDNVLLQEQAFVQVVEEGFAAHDPAVEELFRTFGTLRRFGDNGDTLGLLRKECTTLCEGLRSRGWRLSRLEKWARQDPAVMLAANVRTVARHWNPLLELVCESLERMTDLKVPTDLAIGEARVEILGHLPWLRHAISPEGPEMSPQRCRDLFDRLVQIRGQLGRTQGRKGADPETLAALAAEMRSLRTLLDQQKKLLESFNAGGEEQAARLAHHLLNLAARFWARHSALKRDAGVLDFNDLQAYARELLVQSPAVRARYRRRLRHIMVDEFQDTDALQKQIVDLLRGPDNLFCVGDAKQSIYGFRHADVSIFRRLIEQAELRPGDSTATADSAIADCATADGTAASTAATSTAVGVSPRVHLSLRDNYRCRPEIIRFVNLVFSQIGVGSGIVYEPLESRAPFAARSAPSIELLLTPPKEDGGSESAAPAGAANGAANGGEPAKDGGPAPASYAEADLVARRIRELVDDDAIRITAAGPRQGQRLEYRDFLILLRTFTPLRDYERALAKCDVDYYVIGGRGYYAQREIRDIADLLATIQNPLADVPLASLLRSPFCGLSSEALYALSRVGQEAAFPCFHAGVLAALGRPVELSQKTGQAPVRVQEALDTLPDEDRRRLEAFWPLIDRARVKQDRTPIASLLEEILAETLFEARLLLQPGGRRKMANVRKLVTSASARSACGVSEFLEWLQGLSRVVEREGEAPTEEEAANVVRLRTIHNAKGLEANVVIVAGLAQTLTSSQAQQPSFQFDVRTGAGSCISPSMETLQQQPTATYQALLKSQHAREVDEALRLLYVAMTRAREYLILAGSTQGRGETWASRLLPLLGLRTAPAEDTRAVLEAGLELLVRSRIPGRRRDPAAARLLMERLQLQMRSGHAIPVEDLRTLRAIGQGG